MSVTYSGLWMLLIGFVASKLHIDQTALITTITTIVQIVGFVVAVYGRYRHGDVSIFGFKKPTASTDSQP